MCNLKLQTYELNNRACHDLFINLQVELNNRACHDLVINLQVDSVARAERQDKVGFGKELHLAAEQRPLAELFAGLMEVRSFVSG